MYVVTHEEGEKRLSIVYKFVSLDEAKEDLVDVWMRLRKTL